MGYFSQLLLIAVSTAIVNNVVLSQFLGLCPFLGVSKKINTAAGMGGAVIGVITISSAVCSLIYDCILTPLKLTYLNTIVFILVIAALVQFVEMFLKKTSPSLYEALGVYASHLLQLTVQYLVLHLLTYRTITQQQDLILVRSFRFCSQWIRNSCWFYNSNHNHGWYT